MLGEEGGGSLGLRVWDVPPLILTVLKRDKNSTPIIPVKDFLYKGEEHPMA